MKKDLTKIFIDEIYSTPPRKNYPTNKIVYNHIDEIWSIDLADFLECKTSKLKGFRYIFVIIDNCSKYFRAITIKNKNSKTITDEFSNVLRKSKRKPPKLESDRRSEWYNSIFQNFLRSKNIHKFSRFTNKGPSIAERVIRTVHKLFEKRRTDWLSELPSVMKQIINTIHHSIKMTLIQASKKSNEKIVYKKLRGKREVQKPKFKLGQKVRTSDIRKVFSKGDSTIYSYKLYTITKIIHDTIPSYRTDYLPERYNENLLLPTKVTLEENNQVMKELNLIQFYKK